MTRDDVVLLLNRLLDDYSLVDLEISNTKLLYTLKKNWWSTFFLGIVFAFLEGHKRNEGKEKGNARCTSFWKQFSFPKWE